MTKENTNTKNNKPSISTNELNELIASIGVKGKDFTNEQAIAAYGCIEQVYYHGNGDSATKLFYAMKDAQAMRHMSFKQWFIDNTPFVWHNKKKAFVKDKSKNTEIDLEFCKKHPFFEKQERAPLPLSLDSLKKSLSNTIKKYEKALEKGALIGSVEDTQAYINSLKEISEVYGD